MAKPMLTSWEYQAESWCRVVASPEMYATKKHQGAEWFHLPPGRECPFCPVLAGTKEFVVWSDDHYHCKDCFSLTQIG